MMRKMFTFDDIVGFDVCMTGPRYIVYGKHFLSASLLQTQRKHYIRVIGLPGAILLIYTHV